MSEKPTSAASSKKKKPSTKEGEKQNKEKDKDGEDSVSQEELKNQIKQLLEDVKQEKNQRNFFQLERDKIIGFWDITKNEVDELKACQRNQERLYEEQEERHQVEIKVYKQKVKHLLYEHQNNINQLKLQTDNGLKQQEEDHVAQEMDLKKEKRSLKLELKEMELAHQDLVRNLRIEHEKKVTKIRQDYERMSKELISKYDRKMRYIRSELELRRKSEIHEIEERKNAHIQDLMQKHQKAFAEIKNYYNDITHNNLDLIRTQKEELAEMKKREATNEKAMFEITQQNKQLLEPLQKAMKEVESLKLELENYNKDKMVLQNSKARLKNYDEQLKKLQWEHEVLRQGAERIQKERDDLYERFERAIYDVQQKSGFKNYLLEKKLDIVNDELEKRDVQLTHIADSYKVDFGSVDNQTSWLEAKNSRIKELEYDLQKTKKTLGDLVDALKTKLKENGIPVEQLGLNLTNL